MKPTPPPLNRSASPCDLEGLNAAILTSILTATTATSGVGKLPALEQLHL
jgi:hypothetical protein